MIAIWVMIRQMQILICHYNDFKLHQRVRMQYKATMNKWLEAVGWETWGDIGHMGRSVGVGGIS